MVMTLLSVIHIQQCHSVRQSGGLPYRLLLEVPFVRENTLFPYKFLISPQAKVSKNSRLLKNKTDKMKNRSYRRSGCRTGRHIFRKLPTKFGKDRHNTLNINHMQNSRFILSDISQSL